MFVIPNISVEEQIDRYTRGLKPYIWRKQRTRVYNILNAAMRDAERVESAHRRGGDRMRRREADGQLGNADGPTPMEIGNLRIKKFTSAERQICTKAWICLR